MQQVRQAQILIDKPHMRADTEIFGHFDQACAVHLPFLTLNLRMRCADDQIECLRTGSHDLRHGLNHVFQSLASIDQPKGANDLSSREIQLFLVHWIALEMAPPARRAG